MKYVVVFDIDGVLAHQMDASEIDIPKAKSLHPDSPVAIFKYKDLYTNRERDLVSFWLSYLDVLFAYLIKHDVRIVFVSSAIEERNVSVLNQVLTQIFGASKYRNLKELGQFEIFSEQHLRKGIKENPTGGPSIEFWEGREFGNYIKDLTRIIGENESLENAILIEDQSSFTAYGQRPCINSLDLERWDPSRPATYYNSFAKNGTYYLLGLFKHYFEHKEYSALPLGQGVRKILIEAYGRARSDREEIYYPDNRFYKDGTWGSKEFTTLMICNGLKEVKRIYQQAVLCGTEGTTQNFILKYIEEKNYE